MKTQGRVYVVVGTFDREGADVVGVFAYYGDALEEKARVEKEGFDKGAGPVHYDWVTVEPHNVRVK
jgi:hypothetical protein